MIELAPERNDATHLEQCAELAGTEHETLEPPQCHFMKLPVELITEIFHQDINKSNSRMLELSSVCRAWRELIINTPSFWRRLVVGGKRKQKEVTAWNERSHGRITHLTVHRSITYRSAAFNKVSPDFWSNLKRLEVDCPITPRKNDVPIFERIDTKMKLESLNVTFPSTFGKSMLEGILKKVCLLNLKDLRIEVSESAVLWPTLLSCGSLTRLHLVKSNVPLIPLVEVLSRNVCLKDVELSISEVEDAGSSNGIGTGTAVSTFKLPHVRRFVLTNQKRNHHGALMCGKLISYMDFPALEVLAIKYGWVPVNRSYPTLKALSLRCLNSPSDLVSTTIITMLESTPLLEHLDLSFNRLGDRLVDILSGMGTICPRLQQLYLNGMPGLKTGTVIALVESRLPSANFEVPVDDGRSNNPPGVRTCHASPIKVLELNYCPLIKSEMIMLLYSKVPIIINCWPSTAFALIQNLPRAFSSHSYEN
jgi:hypothetical protein